MLSNLSSFLDGLHWRWGSVLWQVDGCDLFTFVGTPARYARWVACRCMIEGQSDGGGDSGVAA